MRARRALIVAACLIPACGVARAQSTPPAPVLKVAVVVRVEGPPLLESNGQPSPGSERALGEVDAAMRDLSRLNVPFAISASPVWVDELLAAGQPRVYAGLLALATRHPLLHVPYAHMLLPHNSDAPAIAGELARGEASLRQTLQAATQRILDPPGLALSSEVLKAARESGVTATLAPASVIGDQPITDRGMTLIPADVLARVDAAALLDLHGSTGRVAVVVRATRDLDATLKTLSADKRIGLVDIADVTAHPATEVVSFADVPRPPASYTEAIGRAGQTVAGFDSYTLPGNPTAKLLSILLGRARSTVEWQRDWAAGAARAGSIVDLAGAEQSLLSASDGSVTLTSRRAAVPVTVVNRARYPVRVRVRVTSPKLTFPGGDSQTVTVSPGGMTITFLAEARATGSFPMDVSLASPDGRVRFASGRVLVRSTAANVLALVLTLSGLLFLIAWSSRDLIRRMVRGRSR